MSCIYDDETCKYYEEGCCDFPSMGSGYPYDAPCFASENSESLIEGDIMSRELKRCPFCGELPRTEVSVTKMGGGEDHVDFTIHCTNCGTSKTVRLRIKGFVDFFDVEKAQEQVIQAWNQRKVEE